MHSERESLLAAVAADPDADTPRLVFADWLDEHGEPARAAFIRAQIAEWRDPAPWELAGTPRPSSAIEASHRDEWLAFLPEKQRPWVIFERGFPETLRPTRVRTAFLPLLEKPHPELATLTRLEIPDGNGLRDGDYAKIAASAGLRRLRELVIGDYLPSGSGVAAILASPHLARLENLDLAFPMFDARLILTTATASPLRRLTFGPSHMAVGDRNTIRPADIAGSPLLANLTELELTDVLCELGAREALFASRSLPRVERLTLAGYGASAYEGPIESLALPALRHFAVSEPTYSGNALAGAVARSHGAARLEGLSLPGTQVTLGEFDYLVRSPRLPILRRLDVGLDALPEAVADYLLNSDAPLRLEKLYVGTNWALHSSAVHLRAKYGNRLSTHTEAQLAPTLRRLGRW